MTPSNDDLPQFERGDIVYNNGRGENCYYKVVGNLEPSDVKKVYFSYASVDSYIKVIRFADSRGNRFKNPKSEVCLSKYSLVLAQDHIDREMDALENLRTVLLKLSDAIYEERKRDRAAP